MSLVDVAPTHLNQGMMASGGWQQYVPVDDKDPDDKERYKPHDGGKATTVKQDYAAVRAWERGNAAKALQIWDTMLAGTNEFDEGARVRIERNRSYAIRALDSRNRFARYPFDVVESICAAQETRRNAAVDRGSFGAGDGGPDVRTGVTAVILACKRYHLFTRTVNSFLWACTDLDLVTRWICIDDGSHPTERACMQALYPFFEFVWRSASDPDCAGMDVQSHARSLNVARSMVDTPWALMLEDDWLFVTRAPLITRCMAVLQRERADGVRQVFFNRHYIEDMTDGYLSTTGGVHKRDAHGHRYIVHEHVPRDSPDYKAYCERHPHNFAHQPHYSCRPCLMLTDLWRTVGPYRESGKRGAAQGLLPFEDEYARRYAAAGLKSAYLDAIPCIHIGRANRDRLNPTAAPNAYQLNGEPQYGADCVAAKGGPTQDDPSAGSAPHPSGHRFALTVTTCRRLPAFVRSMATTLAMCKDVAVIDRFIVVDDNSSDADREAMRHRFPFFEYILKGPHQRGHAVSMNVVLDAVADCAHVFHTEDDWDFCTPYSLADTMTLIRDIGATQVVLLKQGGCETSVEKHADITYHTRYHNLAGVGTLSFFAAHRAAILADIKAAKAAAGDAWPHPPPVEAAKGVAPFWWPSVTLNPAVWNMKAFRATGERFTEGIDTYFEYDISLRMWAKGARVVMTEGEVLQLPGMTAYHLNGTTRTYDFNGCANHRGQGGRSDCPFCVAQKAQQVAQAAQQQQQQQQQATQASRKGKDSLDASPTDAPNTLQDEDA